MRDVGGIVHAEWSLAYGVPVYGTILFPCFAKIDWSSTSSTGVTFYPVFVKVQYHIVQSC